MTTSTVNNSRRRQPAVVLSDYLTSKTAANTYTISDVEDRKNMEVEKPRLRLCKTYTITSPAVSGDKQHDQFVVQNFTIHEFKWI
eukprot:scaffold17043_cov36-Cyclotella_meneghiniana.AAC.3